jgi:hypothetical protein
MQLLLELAHLRADRRLRAVARLGGFREALQPDDLQKCVELIEIHNTAAPVMRVALVGKYCNKRPPDRAAKAVDGTSTGRDAKT